MPKVSEVIEYYINNGKPLKCRYCGSENNLTKDHIEPKCRVPRKIRRKLWRNKDKNPETYFKQFALCCKKCNRQKGSMNHEEFLEHIYKIVNYLK